VKVGDLVTWVDPGKSWIGIVVCLGDELYDRRGPEFLDRAEVAWVLPEGVTTSYPRSTNLKLATPREII